MATQLSQGTLSSLWSFVNRKNRASQVYRSSVSGLEFGVEDVPPLPLCFLFGLQQLLLSISATIAVPLVVCVQICAGELDSVKSRVTSTFLFMCGVCTILQCFLGVRLPILQGGCHTFLPAVAAVMSLEVWRCPEMGPYLQNNSTLDADEVWQPRMREIQGGIMVASLCEMFIGCTGLLGILLRFIGPITIVPTVCLVGLSLIDIALTFCQAHWGVSSLTVGLLLLFSLYLRQVSVPLPGYTSQAGCFLHRYPLFQMIPVILAVVIGWSLCALLTLFDVAPPSLNTQAKSASIEAAQWFFFPYPGQWGLPTVSVPVVMAMLAATITSIIESVGDYYACARICQVPPPPAHAVNRGIAMEGLGCLLSGAFGSGGATTSYSQNVGAIGFTQVASRAAILMAGAIFLVAGVVGKVGAFLASMPDPVLGAIVLVSFGMVTSVGLSTLSYVDLSSARNMTIIGTSLMVGLMVPRFLVTHPTAIDTGVPDLDRVFGVLCGTSMFVGGVLAFVLDNTVPGSDEERGIVKWRQKMEPVTLNEERCDDVEHKNTNHQDSKSPGEDPLAHVPLEGDRDIQLQNVLNSSIKHSPEEKLYQISPRTSSDDLLENEIKHRPRKTTQSIYDLPVITPYLRRWKWTRYLPFLPSFSSGPNRSDSTEEDPSHGV